METAGVILFYEKCRLCLASPGEKHIFETQDLRQDIIACTGVKILRSDNLPEKICSKCLEIVLNAKELRELAVTNDKYLKTLFLNEHDDDSRETLCLEDQNNEKADQPAKSKKRKKDPDRNRNVKTEAQSNTTLFLNEHDDDSRETLCLEDQNNEEADKPPKKKKRKKDSARDRNVKDEAQLNTQLNVNEDDSRKEKRKENVVGDSDSQTEMVKGNLVSSSTSKGEESASGPSLKVRQDLFEATTTTSDTVKVRNIDDYKKYKERIKLDPDFVVEYECETCLKKYDSYKKLYLHIRQHNKKFICPLDACGKLFSTKGDLEKHLRTHTGVRPYACEICDKTFTQQGTLKAHKENVHYIFSIPDSKVSRELLKVKNNYFL
ncbi:zinc-finger associated domain (zf-AD) domain-containing protein [Phthorimaea operculella]|nr:zinc-finger associated domain (zf-AD) domain-containing protein [Phthorimaea operculella]